MPDWTYLALHFVHTLALAVWIGGLVILKVVAARTAPLDSQQERAESWLAAAESSFQSLLPGCILALAVSSILMIGWYGRLSPWYAIEYVCIGMMSASAVFSLAVLEPRRRSLLQAVPVNGVELREVARVSESARHFTLACGCVALFFS